MNNLNEFVEYLAGHSGSLILFVACIYFLIGIANSIKGNYGMSAMWICYAMANIALFFAEKGI